jgi:hypothetical protein
VWSSGAERARRLALHFSQKCKDFGELRGNFRANFNELRIRFDLKNCEFAFDLVGIGIHNNAKVCETAFDIDKSGGDKGYLVIEILLGDWFVHKAQCYTGRALGVKPLRGTKNLCTKSAGHAHIRAWNYPEPGSTALVRQLSLVILMM